MKLNEGASNLYSLSYRIAAKPNALFTFIIVHTTIYLGRTWLRFCVVWVGGQY